MGKILKWLFPKSPSIPEMTKMLRESNDLMEEFIDQHTIESHVSSCPVYYSTSRADWTVSRDGKVESLYLSDNGYIRTKLTRFMRDVDLTNEPAASHYYREEIYIVSGRIYDRAVDSWIDAGTYVDRPPFQLHGGFKTGDEECLVMEISHYGKRGIKK